MFTNSATSLIGKETRDEGRKSARNQGWAVGRSESRMHLRKPRGQQPVTAHGEPDAGAAQQKGEHDAGDARHSRGGHKQRHPGQANRRECGGNRSGAVQRVIADDARQHERHRDVEHERDGEREQNRAGKLVLRVARLFGGGGQGIVAEDREENDGSPLGDAAEAEGHKGMPIGCLHMRQTDGDDEDDRRDLDDHHGRIEARTPFDAQRQEARDRKAPQHRGEIKDMAWPCSRRAHRKARERHAKLAEQRLQIARPADGNHGDHQRIFEQQIPADNPRDEFAKHSVSIGVGAAGDGDHPGKLGVGKCGSRAGNACNHEGQRHGRPRLCRRHDPL